MLAVSAPPTAPLLARPIVGAPGRVAGVTVLDWPDNGPAPTAFTARTRKLYAVPLVSPVTVVDVAVPAIPVTVRTTVVPVRTCTLNEVIGEPPVAPGVQRTVAWALPAVAVPMAGAA